MKTVLLLLANGFEMYKASVFIDVIGWNETTFLNHSVIMSGFMDPWLSMFDESERTVFFEKLECSLNKYSELNEELKLTVPMVYFECVKR